MMPLLQSLEWVTGAKSRHVRDDSAGVPTAGAERRPSCFEKRRARRHARPTKRVQFADEPKLDIAPAKPTEKPWQFLEGDAESRQIFAEAFKGPYAQTTDEILSNVAAWSTPTGRKPFGDVSSLSTIYASTRGDGKGAAAASSLS